jgi:hypothetical protein
MDAGMAMTARPAVLAALVVALATAACSGDFLNANSSNVPVVQARPEPTDRLHRQAQDALDRWAQAVKDNGGSTITFTGSLTAQIGDWESAVATRDKAALTGGALIASTPLAQDAPAKQQVRWTDGPTVDTEVLSPAQALSDLIADVAHPCASCTPLEITDAKLATSLAQTSTGPAEVPTWVFTINGTAVRVTRVAVDRSVTVTPGPWNVDDPPAGLSIYAARGTPDSRSIDVQFIGASKSCGAVDSTEAVESGQAVVVLVDEQLGDAGCSADGVPHIATVSLSAPLGNRVVLEGRQGLPVPVEKPE